MATEFTKEQIAGKRDLRFCDVFGRNTVKIDLLKWPRI